MRLYLVRHGEAKSAEEDPERGLTVRGTKEAKAVARFLKPLGLKVESVWHSGKARAAQTAEIVGSAVESKQGVVERKGLAPKDDEEDLAKEIEKAGEDVMIVGHLPFLGRLVSELVVGKGTKEVVDFGMSAVVCLEMEEGERARVMWMVGPEVVGEEKGKTRKTK